MLELNNKPYFERMLISMAIQKNYKAAFPLVLSLLACEDEEFSTHYEEIYNLYKGENL